MIKFIFFKLVNLLLYFQPVNFKIIHQARFTTGEQYTMYTYNNRIYIHIGNSFPPSIKSGFTPSIKSAHIDGMDITDYIKKCAGPKHDFYGSHPDPSLLNYRLKPKITVNFISWKISFHVEFLLERGPVKPIVIENIFNQQLVLGKT